MWNLIGANRLTEERERIKVSNLLRVILRQNHVKHVDRVINVKPKIKVRPPASFKHMEINLKKLQKKIGKSHLSV